MLEKITSVSKSTISIWSKNIKTEGYKSRKHKNTNEIIETIKFIIKTNDFVTISEIQTYLKKNRNIECSRELIRILMKTNMSLSYKKCKYEYFKNESKVRERTLQHHLQMKELLKTNKLIASIDEIGFVNNLNPLYAWSKKGKKKYIKHNLVDGKKSSCACITSKGNIFYKTIDKSFKTLSFFEFFKSLQLPINTIILIDNASIHKSKIIKEYAISKSWFLIFIPPYSPCFNPIENVFSSVKHHCRKYKSIDDAFKKATLNTIQNSINRCISKTLDINQIYERS